MKTLLSVLVAALFCFGCKSGRDLQPQTVHSENQQRSPIERQSPIKLTRSLKAGRGSYSVALHGQRITIPIRVLLSPQRIAGYQCEPIRRGEPAAQAVERVRIILTRLPSPFLAECSGRGGLTELVVCSSIVRVADHTSWDGLCRYLRPRSTKSSQILVSVSSLAEILAHEFAHCYDWAEGRIESHDDEWTKTNPPTFSYSGHTVTNDRPAPDGFAEAYGMTNSHEDRATVFQELLSDRRDAFLQRAANDPALRSKIEVWASRLPLGRLPWMCPLEATKFGRSGTWLLATRSERLTVEVLDRAPNGLVHVRIGTVGLCNVRRIRYTLHGGFAKSTIVTEGDLPIELECWKEARVTAVAITMSGPISLSVRINL